MRTGRRAGYLVIEWDDGTDADLSNIVKRFPQVVVDKHVAIASCDSGPYVPSTDELTAGWTRSRDLAISPRITAISQLPMPHFDEWYIYDGDPQTIPHRAFVNRAGFAPLNDDAYAEDFWSQVKQLQPTNVLGAGTPTLFMVTLDSHLYSVATRLSEAEFE